MTDEAPDPNNSTTPASGDTSVSGASPGDGSASPSTDGSAIGDAPDDDDGCSGDNEVPVARTSSDLQHSNALALNMVRIRVFDESSNPMGGAVYSVAMCGQTYAGVADADGWVEIHCQGHPKKCQLQWGGSAESYLYEQTITLNFHQEPQTALTQRLLNLGYADSDQQANVAAFKSDYGYGDADDAAAILEGWHDDPTTVKPKQAAAAGDADSSGDPNTDGTDEDYG